MAVLKLTQKLYCVGLKKQEGIENERCDFVRQGLFPSLGAPRRFPRENNNPKYKAPLEVTKVDGTQWRAQWRYYPREGIFRVIDEPRIFRDEGG